MQVNNIMDLLGNDWQYCMAYALTLVEKVSDMDNIIQNSQTKGDTNAKKRRQKMMTKKNRMEVAEVYYGNTWYFKKAKNTNAAKAKEWFMKWDKFAGIITDPKMSTAQKCPSVAPIGGQPKKQKLDEDRPRQLPVSIAKMLAGDDDFINPEYEDTKLPPLTNASSSDTTDSDDMAVAKVQGREAQSVGI